MSKPDEILRDFVWEAVKAGCEVSFAEGHDAICVYCRRGSLRLMLHYDVLVLIRHFPGLNSVMLRTDLDDYWRQAAVMSRPEQTAIADLVRTRIHVATTRTDIPEQESGE